MALVIGPYFTASVRCDVCGKGSRLQVRIESPLSDELYGAAQREWVARHAQGAHHVSWDTVIREHYRKEFK